MASLLTQGIFSARLVHKSNPYRQVSQLDPFFFMLSPKAEATHGYEQNKVKVLEDFDVCRGVPAAPDSSNEAKRQLSDCGGALSPDFVFGREPGPSVQALGASDHRSVLAAARLESQSQGVRQTYCKVLSPSLLAMQTANIHCEEFCNIVVYRNQSPRQWQDVNASSGSLPIPIKIMCSVNKVVNSCNFVRSHVTNHMTSLTKLAPSTERLIRDRGCVFFVS